MYQILFRHIQATHYHSWTHTDLHRSTNGSELYEENICISTVSLPQLKFLVEPPCFCLIWPSGEASICNWAVALSSLLLSSIIIYWHWQHHHYCLCAVILATSLIRTTSLWHPYWHPSPVDEHWVNSAYGIYIAFVRHIYFWHIYCNSILIKNCCLLLFHLYVQ